MEGSGERRREIKLTGEMGVYVSLGCVAKHNTCEGTLLNNRSPSFGSSLYVLWYFFGIGAHPYDPCPLAKQHNPETHGAESDLLLPHLYRLHCCFYAAFPGSISPFICCIKSQVQSSM